MKAWEWLKKYWGYVVTGLLVFISFAFGVAISRRRTPVAPSPNPVKEKAEEEAISQVRKAEQRAEDKKADALKANEEEKKEFLDTLVEKTEEVRSSTDRTNDYLQNVGKEVRGDGQ